MDSGDRIGSRTSRAVSRIKDLFLISAGVNNGVAHALIASVGGIGEWQRAIMSAEATEAEFGMPAEPLVQGSSRNERRPVP